MATPRESNTLGQASLVLGILSVALVFGIGLCALVGVGQGWIQAVGTVHFVCGASSAFLGVLGAVLGFVGLFGRRRPRAAAVVGLIMGLGGLCLFLAVVGAIRAGLGG